MNGEKGVIEEGASRHTLEYESAFERPGSSTNGLTTGLFLWEREHGTPSRMN